MGTVCWIALFSALAACGSDPVGCDPCHTDAFAFGTVTDRPGNPWPRIDVMVLAFEDFCELGFGGVGQVRTDSAGRYHVELRAAHSPFTARCFLVIINPEAISGLPTDTLEFAGSLDFRFRPDAIRLDSIRLDPVTDADVPID